LKTEIFCLPHDVYQEDTDRNRTSPYAYTGNKFEFRALGSSQNAAFPMAVIAATLAKEFKIVTDKLSKGYTCPQLIEELRVDSQAVRF
jgi:glutamine synthetase